MERRTEVSKMPNLIFLVVIAVEPVATICHGEISTQTYMQCDATRCKKRIQQDRKQYNIREKRNEKSREEINTSLFFQLLLATVVPPKIYKSVYHDHLDP